MSRCELCKRKASIRCESDKACLCWDCDAKVHSANFLVARHSRNLLCRFCQSATAWYASGSVLSRTVSVCKKCGNGNRGSLDAVEEGEEEIVPPLWPESESSSCGGEVVFSGKRRRENACDLPSDDDRDYSAPKLKIFFPPSAAVLSTYQEEETENSPANEAPPPSKIGGMTPVRGATELGILESLRRFRREEFCSRVQVPECYTLSLGPTAVDLGSCDSS